MIILMHFIFIKQRVLSADHIQTFDEMLTPIAHNSNHIEYPEMLVGLHVHNSLDSRQLIGQRSQFLSSIISGTMVVNYLAL